MKNKINQRLSLQESSGSSENSAVFIQNKNTLCLDDVFHPSGLLTENMTIGNSQGKDSSVPYIFGIHSNKMEGCSVRIAGCHSPQYFIMN